MALSTGLTLECEARSGGIQAIHFASRDSVDSFNLNGDVYDSAAMSGGGVFYEYEFEQDTGEIRENGSQENGSTAQTHELEFFLPKISTAVRNAIQALIDCSPCGLIAIVTDSNGLKWVVGYSETNLKKRPLKINSDATLSGKGFTDLNGSTVIMQSIDSEKMREFTGTIPV